MNKSQAKKIAQSGITYGQLKRMLIAAYNAGAADNKRGRVNKSLDRACAYNIFWKAFRDEADEKVVTGMEYLGAMNSIREFGEFSEWKPERPKPRNLPEPYHESPIDPYVHLADDDIPF